MLFDLANIFSYQQLGISFFNNIGCILGRITNMKLLVLYAVLYSLKSFRKLFAFSIVLSFSVTSSGLHHIRDKLGKQGISAHAHLMHT